MAARVPHPQTIFHLCPTNDKAELVLNHPDNESYASRSGNGRVGLEVGYHVAVNPCPEKLVEVGRNADLIIPGNAISAVHFSFEVHPESKSIMFYDRSRNYTTHITPYEFRGDGLFRQVVIQPGVQYTIGVGGINKNVYEFEVVWPAALKNIPTEVERGYLQAAQRPLNPRLARTVDETTTTTDLPSYYNTRLHTPNGGGVERFQMCERLGEGAFGKVSKAVDLDSGCFVAVKELTPSREVPEALIRREVKSLSSLSHKNIVEYLGAQGWGTPTIHIFNPLKHGNTRALFDADHSLRMCGQTFNSLLRQMLEALDYLSYRGLIHRDVKPDNILYTKSAQNYLFQLADFGLSRQATQAGTICGTLEYMAPELFRQQPQTAKMDVWSLFISILDLAKVAKFTRNFNGALSLAKAGLQKFPSLAPLGHEDPVIRASAGQVLIALYDGKGLTTPRSQLQRSSCPPVVETPQPVDTQMPKIAAASKPQVATPRPDYRVSKAQKKQVGADWERGAALLLGAQLKEPRKSPRALPPTDVYVVR